MEGTNNHEHNQSKEQLSVNDPAIYAASLADYNDGRLHGRWIKANQEAEEIQAEISNMLAESRMAYAEEWAIHDYEGFASFQVSEYESIPTVARIAQGIAEHGPAFAHWVDHVGTSDADALEGFEEHYLGEWQSLTEYAEQMVDDLGVNVEKIGPGWIRPYVSIDYEMLGRDLATDLYVSEQPGETHLFEL